MDLRRLLDTQHKRKARADIVAFNPLIATPAETDFPMSANGRIRFVSVDGCAAGTTAATLTGTTTRTIKTPLLAAGGSVKLDRVERGTVVTPASGFDVELDCGLGIWRKIGGGAGSAPPTAPEPAQIKGGAGGSGAAVALTFDSPVAVGSVVIAVATSYRSPIASYTSSTLTTGGTATLGPWQLDLQQTKDNGSSNRQDVAFWSAVVTGAGTLTVTLPADTSDFQNFTIYDVPGIDRGHGRAAASASNSAAGTGGSVAMTTGNVVGTGHGLFIAGFAAYSPGTGTFTDDPNLGVDLRVNNAVQNVSVTSHLSVAASATHSADYTLSVVSTQGYAAGMVFYKGAGGNVVRTFTPGAASDNSAFGYITYPSGVNGIPGSPFGTLSPAKLEGYDVREFSWDPSGNFYLAITNAGVAPDAPFFTSLSFTDNNAVVWTLTDAASAVPGGLSTTYNGEDIQYWTWSLGSAPVVTATPYTLTITGP